MKIKIYFTALYVLIKKVKFFELKSWALKLFNNENS